MPFDTESFDSKDQRDERYDDLRNRVDAEGALKHPGLVKFSSNQPTHRVGRILPNYAGRLEVREKDGTTVIVHGRFRQIAVSTWSVAWPRH